MTILDEAMQKPKIEDIAMPGGAEQEVPETPQSPGIRIDFSALWEFIKTDCGPGELEDYEKSPLSLGSKGIARILWGISGFIGYALKDLNRSAVVQIVVGLLELAKEKRVAVGASTQM